MIQYILAEILMIVQFLSLALNLFTYFKYKDLNNLIISLNNIIILILCYDNLKLIQ